MAREGEIPQKESIADVLKKYKETQTTQTKAPTAVGNAIPNAPVFNQQEIGRASCRERV